MQNRVRAIIVKNSLLLTVKRVKGDKAYWVLPGGGVDVGENHQQALIRECKEELGIDVSIGKLFLKYIFTQGEHGPQKEFFYDCEIIGGELGTGDGPEFDSNSKYEGIREIRWIKMGDLNNFDLRPLEVRNELLKKYENDKIK